MAKLRSWDLAVGNEMDGRNRFPSPSRSRRQARICAGALHSPLALSSTRFRHSKPVARLLRARVSVFTCSNECGFQCLAFRGGTTTPRCIDKSCRPVRLSRLPAEQHCRDTPLIFRAPAVALRDLASGEKSRLAPRFTRNFNEIGVDHSGIENNRGVIPETIPFQSAHECGMPGWRNWQTRQT